MGYFKFEKGKKLTDLEKRIRNIPKYYIARVEARRKKEADQVVKEFKKGIRNNDMGLHPLKPATIKQKSRMGYSRPDNPLYGKGDQDIRSYINSLYLKKIKNGWSVEVSRKMHHKARLTLKHLFFIHEYGAVIKGRSNAFIRIPPRPALKTATEQVQFTFKDDGVDGAVAEYVNTGKDKAIKKIISNYERGLEKYYET